MSGQLVILAASVAFLFHLICETLASFVKYNFASIGRHMQGVALSNILAVLSRGFVAVYGLVIAYVIENRSVDIYLYTIYLSISLVLGAIFSLWCSKLKINEFDKFVWRDIFEVIVYDGNPSLNLRKEIRIKNYLRLFLGVQFVAIVIAYGLCFSFPENRLFIVSLVPLISMLGTIVTVGLVEPRFARFIDLSKEYGNIVSKEFMEARAISFAFSFLLILMINLFLV